MMKKFNFIDLFAGLGGFRIALQSFGGNCVFSSEIDIDVSKIYFENFGDMPSGDITKINEDSIPNFDILTAGFPCQAFSIAGKRLGFDDTRGTLFFDVARIIKEKKPKAFILENVQGLTNHDNGKTLAVIMDVLFDLEYNVIYKVLNAKDLGYPQNRKRWYCVGFRKDLNINTHNFKWPIKKRSVPFEKILESKVDESYLVSKVASSNILKHIKEKKVSVDDYTIAYDIRPSRCQFKNDKISPCLTAKMGTGGNNVPVIVSQSRRLTERECLRLMGYPDDYKIGKGNKAYKQIGNSVVLPIIKDISEELLRLLRFDN
jgi:DNA (cytosine-5)-methyltransferase 1